MRSFFSPAIKISFDEVLVVNWPFSYNKALAHFFFFGCFFPKTSFSTTWLISSISKIAKLMIHYPRGRQSTPISILGLVQFSRSQNRFSCPYPIQITFLGATIFRCELGFPSEVVSFSRSDRSFYLLPISWGRIISQPNDFILKIERLVAVLRHLPGRLLNVPFASNP